MSEKPTDKELEEFWRGLADGAHSDLIPKMRASFMCLALLDGTVNLHLALQIGIALLLDKPLVIVAVGKAVKVSPRLRQIAEVVIEAGTVAEMKTKLQPHIERLVRHHRDGTPFQ